MRRLVDDIQCYQYRALRAKSRAPAAVSAANIEKCSFMMGIHKTMSNFLITGVVGWKVQSWACSPGPLSPAVWGGWGVLSSVSPVPLPGLMVNVMM